MWYPLSIGGLSPLHLSRRYSESSLLLLLLLVEILIFLVRISANSSSAGSFQLAKLSGGTPAERNDPENVLS